MIRRNNVQVKMENGGSDLAYKFAGLGINGANNDSTDALFQVMKAVEAAEATIKQQVLCFIVWLFRESSHT